MQEVLLSKFRADLRRAGDLPITKSKIVATKYSTHYWFWIDVFTKILKIYQKVLNVVSINK